MAKVKEGDFIELEYLGKLKNGKIIDTNIKEEADKLGFKGEVKPLILQLGSHQVIKGLEEDILGKEIGKKYVVEVIPEKAYGKRDSKLVRILNINLFKKEKMNPVPGMQINADGRIGVVRSVSGGRVTADFNHMLAGKELTFEYKILKIIEDDKVKINNLINTILFLREELYELNIKEDKLEIISKMEIPKQFQDIFKEKLEKTLPKYKNIVFKVNAPLKNN